MAQVKERFLKLDWLLCHSRWLLLAAVLAVSLLDILERADFPLLYFVLAAGACYNAIVLFLLLFELSPPSLPTATLIVDTVLLASILYATGRGYSPLFLFGLFPTVVAALRFGLEASFLVAMGLTLADWAFIFIDQLFPPTEFSEPTKFLLLGLDVAVLFTTAALTSSISSWEKHTLTAEWEEELKGLLLARDRARMIYEMASTLSATLNYRRVLDSILDLSILGFEELGQKDTTSISMVLLFEGDRLSIAASKNLAKGDEKRKIEGRAGLVWQAISSAEPVIASEVSRDPELKKFTSLQTCRSVICVPLRAGFETYGVILFASPQSQVYTPEHVELLTALCNQTVIALRNAQLYQSLREEKDKIIHSEEEARRKLARDLHDGPTQSVAAIAMRLNFAKLLVDKEPLRAREELEKLEDLALRTTKEIRMMLFALRPVILETQGLIAALEQYAQKLEEAEGLSIHIEADELDDRLGVNVEAVSFAIIEEAITNAKKHAQAQNIYVRLRAEDDLFIAEVEDDGVGFDLAAVEKEYERRGSLGLINLRERAELVDGILTIDSVLGRGTKVTLVVPVDRDMD